MKKKIFLGLLLGALSFSSCVKDNESEAVKKQRDAQAELLLAEAKVKNSEADLKTAEAKVKDAQAKLEEALIQSKVDAATASATLVVEEAARKVEDEKLKKEKILAKFEAELAKAKAEAENIQAEAAALKANNLSKLVSGVSTASSQYSTAVNAVATKEDEISDLTLKIVKLKAGVISATEYVKREKAEKEAKIEAKKLELEAYEDMVKSNFGTINEIKAKLSKKENEVDVADIAYQNEFDKVKNSVADGTSYKKALTKLSGEELVKLAFFKNVKEAYGLAFKAAQGVPANGFLLMTDARDFAGKLAKSTTNMAGTGTNLLIENDGSALSFDKTSSGPTENYQLKKEKYSTEAELQAGFFDETYVETAKGYFDLKTKDAKKVQKQKEGAVTTAEAAYTAASASATTNTDTTQQAALDAKVQQKKKALAEAKAAKQEADEKVTEAEDNKKAFEAAVTEIKKAANQKEVLGVVTKFIEEQKTLKGKLDKLKELKDKVDELTAEKDAIENTVKNVAQVIAGQDTADKIAEKIKSTKEDIAGLEEDIASLDSDKKQENLVKKEEAKLERYKKELDLLNKKLDAARTAYEAAIEALKKANA